MHLASQGLEARAGELLAAVEALGEGALRARREISSLDTIQLKKIEGWLGASG